MKKLQWSFHHGICVVKGTYQRAGSEKFFDFHLTTLQTAIIMLYNDSLVYTFEQIRLALDMDAEMLKKMLHSLSRKRIAILLADTKEGVKPETEFTINENFKS